LEKHFAKAPPKVTIKDGSAIEFLGRRMRIVHSPLKHRNVYHPPLEGGSTALVSRVGVGLQDGEHYLPHPETLRVSTRPQGAGNWPYGFLEVGGAPEMLERRVRDFIKAELLKEIKQIIKETEFRPSRITLRDTTSRWGSCSSTGALSFSWRLAFAPPMVLRYVVMHELAHCRHMNHGDEFWALVNELYGPGMATAKRWLTKNGAGLHMYF
jgi:hypothetical protein